MSCTHSHTLQFSHVHVAFLPQMDEQADLKREGKKSNSHIIKCRKVTHTSHYFSAEWSGESRTPSRRVALGIVFKIPDVCLDSGPQLPPGYWFNV